MATNNYADVEEGGGSSAGNNVVLERTWELRKLQLRFPVESGGDRCESVTDGGQGGLGGTGDRLKSIIPA